MNIRIRAAVSAAASSIALVAFAAPAQANLLSVLPGSCGSQQESQVFSPWGDGSNYFLLTGGSFEGAQSWVLTGGAARVSGNESFHVGNSSDQYSMALPAGGQALSPAVCTSIYNPTLRFFARNTGSSSSRLKVEALYPGLLGAVHSATIGYVSGSSAWQPTPTLKLTVTNLLATISLDETAVAYRFTPADASGDWTIDDVYVDPRCK